MSQIQISSDRSTVHNFVMYSAEDVQFRVEKIFAALKDKDPDYREKYKKDVTVLDELLTIAKIAQSPKGNGVLLLDRVGLEKVGIWAEYESK